MASKQIVVLNFQDPSGQPLAGGEVTFRLNYDISANVSLGPQVAAGKTVSATADSAGTVTVELWPNDVTLPANSIYFVSAFTAEGQPAWNGELSVAEGDQYLLQEDLVSIFYLEGSVVDGIILEP